MSDHARSRVYGAEAQVRALFDSADAHHSRAVHTLGSTLTLPVERRFASVASVQAYVDAVLALGWIRGRFAVAPVTVRARRGASAAHYEPTPPVIAVPVGSRWALRELVVLHELAHHLAPDVGHGPGYVQAMLALVDGVIGPEAALVLRAALHENSAV